MRKVPSWIIILFIILIALPVFFFKLGQSSLVSWDEAWYASIGVNVLKTGNLIKLWFNGAPFLDHPPFGFWLVALTFKLFGVSAFSARASSAFFAVLTLIFVFLVGKEISGRLVGFLSSAALISAPWFVQRARSGDLDVFLTFLFVISFYFAILAQKQKKYLYLLAVTLAFLLITKTLIPFAIFPALIYLFWKNKKYKIRDFVALIVLIFLPFAVWSLVNAVSYSGFVSRFFFIGTRGVTTETNFLSNLLLIKQYLRVGIGVWFWPSILSFAIGIFLRKKSLNTLLIFFLTFLIPFIFSQKGQIWHFIPFYPIMILNLMVVSSIILNSIFEMKILVLVVLVVPTIYFAYKQIKQNWFDFIDIAAYISDEEILSREAGKYPEKFYIDDDYIPAAAFYSGKIVTQVDKGSLLPFFRSNEKFVLITKQWRLDQSGIRPNEYHILKTDRDKILLEKI